MRKFIQNLAQIMPLVHNSLIPALVFGCALLGFYLYGDIAPASMLTLHYAFFTLCGITLSILLYFNRRKPFFFILVILAGYVLINHFKKLYSMDYLSSPAYQNLCFFVPLNLALFYFYPPRRLLTRKTVFWLLFVFAEFALAEKLTSNSFVVAFNLSSDFINLSTVSFLLFFAFCGAAFVRMTVSGQIADTGLFFSGLNIFCGFYYSASATALTIFFSAAAATICLTVAKDLYYSTYKDVLTGLASRNAYLRQSPHFPLKYSLGIVCIDNYEHLGKVFGRRGINALAKMIALRLSEAETENTIYRYSEDEFVIIFKNEDKKESFNRLENIRRMIAASEFMLGARQKPLKLTVSCCVSEKKRSDDNSFEVLLRTRKALMKAYSFTQNVTSQA